MTTSGIPGLIAVLVFCMLGAAQQSVTSSEPRPEFSVGLAPGDTVEVHFLDFPEASDMHLTVSPIGTLFVPYAGPVTVAGMMPDEAEAALANALKSKNVVKDPQVSLTVLAARNLTAMVVGEVKTPHPVQLFSAAPLSFILGQVGGFTELANYHVLISHADGSSPTDVELDRSLRDPKGMDALVRPGDLVAVVRAGSFFALGEFNHPGIFPLTGVQHMTLLQAMAVAGGPTINAKLSKIYLMRDSDGHRVVLEIDYEKVRDGKASDLPILPNDILIVNRSGGRVFLNSWLQQSLFAATVAAQYK